MNKRIITFALQCVPAVTVLVAWQIIGGNSARLNFLFGTPVNIVKALTGKILDGSIFLDTGITALEASIGFVIGTATGSFFGLLMWFSALLAKIAKPYVLVLGAVPVLALAPVFIVWFGVGLMMKLAMATLGTFFVALLQAYEGASNVDQEQIKLMKVFGASDTQIFRKVIISSSLVWVFASLKLNIGFAVLGAFIGEFISSERGLGHLIIKSGALYDVPLVFAGSLVIIVLAFLLNYIVTWIEGKRFFIIEYLSMPSIISRRNTRILLSNFKNKSAPERNKI